MKVLSNSERWLSILGDAGGLILNSVPQYASMRLEEVIFQVICQTSVTEPTCSESRLYGCLANIFSEMQSHPPPRQAVYAAISSLIKSGLIYYCGEYLSLCSFTLLPRLVKRCTTMLILGVFRRQLSMVISWGCMHLLQRVEAWIVVGHRLPGAFIKVSDL